MNMFMYDFEVLVGWGGECVTPILLKLVKHTCPQPVTGLVSRLVFTGTIPVLHTNLWFQIHLKSEADIWLSIYDHLTDVGGQRGVYQHLLQLKGACFLLNKKEA